MFRVLPSPSRHLAGVPGLILAIAIVPVLLACTAAPAAPGTPAEPSSPVVTPAPAATPKPTPITPPATPAPSVDPDEEPGHDAIPITVDIATFDRHHVVLDVDDRTGTVVSATSGRPGDGGASVEPYKLVITNVDETTLRLQWVDYPIDNHLTLFVVQNLGKMTIALVQPPPTGATDSIALDRELLLTFDRPVDARTVEAILQDGVDTVG